MGWSIAAGLVVAAPRRVSRGEWSQEQRPRRRLIGVDAAGPVRRVGSGRGWDGSRPAAAQRNESHGMVETAAECEWSGNESCEVYAKIRAIDSRSQQLNKYALGSAVREREKEKKKEQKKTRGAGPVALLCMSLRARSLMQHSQCAGARKYGDGTDDGEHGELLEDVERQPVENV